MNYKIIVTLLTIMLGLSLACKVLFEKVKVKDEKISMLAVNLKAEQRKTIYWIDECGREHSKSVEQTRAISDLKRNSDSLSILIRSKAKENGILLKKIQAFAEIESTIKHDTIVKHPFLYGCHDLSNKYITQTVCINRDSSISSSVSIDPLTDIFWTTTKETVNPPYKFFLWRLFQKKQNITTVEVINNNPLVKTKSQKFVITNK